ncbi:MAG: hypothetical protein LBK28_06595, partial [Propionibacteriaceae bacterium]|nr:hypothetical protein [Propionibacteriaceae bacterium]
RILVLQAGGHYALGQNYINRFNRGISLAAEGLGVSISFAYGQGFFACHQAVGQALESLGPDVGFVTNSTIDPADVLSSLLLHGRTPGKDVSLVATGAPHEFPEVEGYQIAGIDQLREETLGLAVDRLMELIRDDPAAMRPGDFELTTPTFVPGNTLRS